MKMQITGITTEVSNLLTRTKDDWGKSLDEFNSILSKDFKIFSGKNAGICYLGDSYNELDKVPIETLMDRFKRVIGSAHHSVSDHVKITVVFEEIPKIFAMILNSFQDYATSEKSARYTIMNSLSEKEKELYDKWYNKLLTLLYDRYGGKVHKYGPSIARENARYFISIFSPSTTMAYTTSLRQWNYINSWFKDLISNTQINEDEWKGFGNNLIPTIKEFVDLFEKTPIYCNEIQDVKHRQIDFIPQMYDGLYNNFRASENMIGESYVVSYMCSFSALAQLQRHRSIKYMITDIGPAINGIHYIPKLIENNGRLLDEWVSDMYSIDDIFPQGQLVVVTEYGTIDKFILKCMERLCGRVQLETMDSCTHILGNMYRTIESMEFDIKHGLRQNNQYISQYHASKIKSMVDKDENGELIFNPKCIINGNGCADSGCYHGNNYATRRVF